MGTVKIGAGGAYWGDALEPAIEMAKLADVQYMGFDFLAELTMSVLQRMRQKDPTKGYVPDIVPWAKALLPLSVPRGIGLVANVGGANPEAAGEVLAKLAGGLGLKGLKIGTVGGDDILGRLDQIRADGWAFRNMDTGEADIDRIRDRIVAANVYVGADHIIGALAEGAKVVITGRASDNALYVGPIMHEMGWQFRKPYWDKIGAAITMGHIVECTSCCTGGMSTQWERVQNAANISFPIVEMEESGEAIITKMPNTGGFVDEWTVKEHLVYEIGDPKRYLMPDGIADFTTLKVKQEGPDRVRVSGCTGLPRPDTLKVQIGYEDGYIGEGLLLFPWPHALQRAQRAEEVIRARFAKIGVPIEELDISYVGVNTLGGHTAPPVTGEMNEVGLRVAARTRTAEDADAVRRECTHLWTLGPVGTAFGVPFKPRKVVSLWPTLVPRELVRTNLSIKEVS